MAKEPVREQETSGTLDLSMKKSRSPEFGGNHSAPPQQLSSTNNKSNGSHSSHIPMILPQHQPAHLYKHASLSPHEPPNNTYYQSTQVGRLEFKWYCCICVCLHVFEIPSLEQF